MDISAAAAAPQSLEFNSTSDTSKVDYNPPPVEEGIAPSREAIAAENAAPADPRGRNLNTFA